MGPSIRRPARPAHRIAAALAALLVAVAALAPAAPRSDAKIVAEQPIGQLELVHAFDDAMPTGVAAPRLSESLFVCFPRWEPDVATTLGELLPNGKLVPFPDARTNRPDPQNPKNSLFCVQSVVADAQGRLWALDTGRVQFGAPPPGAAKLVCYDPKTRQQLASIPLTPSVLTRPTYLNDLRIDLRVGEAGTAYVTDSEYQATTPVGPRGGGLVTVDLASGSMERHLDSDPSVLPEDIAMLVESRLFALQPSPEAAPTSVGIASDGIALSPDGATIFYCPLSSRRLYAIPSATLLDPLLDPADRAKAVVLVGDKPMCDGMICDLDGRIYITAVEHNAILRARPTPKGLADWETVAADARLLWPDSLAISYDGYLYIIVNQLHRRAMFRRGEDQRQPPYALFRVNIGRGPASAAQVP